MLKMKQSIKRLPRKEQKAVQRLLQLKRRVKMPHLHSTVPAPTVGAGLPDMSWCNRPKWGKRYQVTIIYLHIPNGHKLHQLGVK
jgi:hypothetical protein